MIEAERARLRREGALLPVRVADIEGQSAPLPCVFLVDTGADMSVISRETVEALGLSPRRRAVLQGIVSTIPRRVNVYRVAVIVDGREIEVDAAALPREPEEPDGLLGRDVLEHLRFTYDGPRGVFALGGE